MDNNYTSKDVKNTLEKLDVHEEWEQLFRTSENEPFFKLALDYITGVLDAPKDSIILDTGCGTCQQSIRLANRGFRCVAVDFSEAILEKARTKIKKEGLEGRIIVQREDLTSLSFQNETFSYVLCWGVLMHIPDLEKAVSELSRVLKPNGKIIVGESNLYSLQPIIGSIVFPVLRILLGRKSAKVKHTKFGIEQWTTSNTGLLFTRLTNVGQLIHAFEKKGFVVTKRVPGEFTQWYTLLPNRLLRSLVHGINGFWFSHIRIAWPAFTNIIILDKEG